MKPDRTIRSGFSLIELMLAMGIMSVGLMMIGTTLPAGIMNSDESNLKTNATIISDNAATILREQLHHTVLKNWFIQKFNQDSSTIGQFIELSQSRNSLLNDPNPAIFAATGIPTDTGLTYADRFYPRASGTMDPTRVTAGFPMWPGSVMLYETAAGDFQQAVKTSLVSIAGVNVFLTDTGGNQYFAQPASRFAWLVMARPVGLPVVSGRYQWTYTTAPNDYEFIIVPVRRYLAEDPLLEITLWPGKIYGSRQFRFDAVGGQVPLDGAGRPLSLAPRGTLVICAQDWFPAAPAQPILSAGDSGWVLYDSGDQKGWVLRPTGIDTNWPQTTRAYAVVDIDLGSGTVKTPNALGVSRIRMSLQN